MIRYKVVEESLHHRLEYARITTKPDTTFYPSRMYS